MNPLAQLDLQHVWHPFTQMQDWLKSDPIVIVRGRGIRLWDALGRSYLDGNASIWTNLHGHANPQIDRAIRAQLKKVAHTSALGLANEPASLLAHRLVRAVNHSLPQPVPGNQSLTKVFYSDDGSTALETALKLSHEFARRTRGPEFTPRYLSLQGGYHGDTMGAVSLGHIGTFHDNFKGLQFKSDSVMAPYCYRCPYNRAEPARADARTYRQCNWECVDEVQSALDKAKDEGRPYSAFTFEPGIQGAAGMIPQPEGWLRRVATRVRDHGALLIADEVFTGMARTNVTLPTGPKAHTSEVESSNGEQSARVSPYILASQEEGVQPDFAVLAKGLSGGYLPLGATLTTQAIFDAFLGDYSDFKSFFHGHSYSGNQLGCAAALASIDILESSKSRDQRATLASALANDLSTLWHSPWVGDIRQVGLIAAVELVENWQTRQSFPLTSQVGIRVCHAMARRGVLTRPVGNVIPLIPPYVTSPRQMRQMIHALAESIEEVLPQTLT